MFPMPLTIFSTWIHMNSPPSWTKILRQWCGTEARTRYKASLWHCHTPRELNKYPRSLRMQPHCMGLTWFDGFEAFGPKWATKHLRIFFWLRCRNSPDPLKIDVQWLQFSTLKVDLPIPVASGSPWQHPWLHHRCHWLANQAYQEWTQQLVCNWFQNPGAGCHHGNLWDVWEIPCFYMWVLNQKYGCLPPKMDGENNGKPY